jgi:hypothetical protein
MTDADTTGITPDQAAALMVPFPPEVIGKKPQPYTKDAPKENCAECGGYHGRGTHLDYVGHAAVTKRLLEVDPHWTWEPLALTEQGLPALDRDGNLWIKLTIGGTTRLGVGDGGMKEKIGDAIRNAAMRFGVALDLWSKEDLHATLPEQPPEPAHPLQLDAIRKMRSRLDDVGKRQVGGWWRIHDFPRDESGKADLDRLTKAQADQVIDILEPYMTEAGQEQPDPDPAPDTAPTPEEPMYGDPEASPDDVGDATPGDSHLAAQGVPPTSSDEALSDDDIDALLATVAAMRPKQVEEELARRDAALGGSVTQIAARLGRLVLADAGVTMRQDDVAERIKALRLNGDYSPTLTEDDRDEPRDPGPEFDQDGHQ